MKNVTYLTPQMDHLNFWCAVAAIELEASLKKEMDSSSLSKLLKISLPLAEQAIEIKNQNTKFLHFEATV